MTRRGITLIDMVVALALMGVFLLAASPLFIGALRTMRDAQRADAAVAAFDLALRQMRRDVRSAAAMATLDERQLALTLPDGPRVTWTIDQGRKRVRLVRRTDRPTDRRPAELRFDVASAGTADFAFGLDHDTLLLHTGDTTMALVSQVMRTRRAVP